MDLFETFTLGSTLSRLADITSSFGKKPISISGMVADHDSRGGDMENCDAATDDQVMCGELCKDRKTLLLFRHSGDDGDYVILIWSFGEMSGRHGAGKDHC